MEIRIRNTPHARIPPIIGRFVPTAEALPYTATPIRMNATSCNIKKKNSNINLARISFSYVIIFSEI
jgi:hypothetical protein